MITLEIKYRVPEGNRDAFEASMRELYPPALAPQRGFVESRLLRVFDEDLRSGIAATHDGYDFHLELTFESEEARLAWVASPEHDPPFHRAQELSTEIVHSGYTLVDRQVGPSYKFARVGVDHG